MLKNSGEFARLQVQIIGPRTTVSWVLTIVDKTCTVERKRVKRPEIEIITAEETYWDLAKAAISPVEAFIAGKMEISGNSDLISRIYKKLASRGRTDFCVPVKEVT
ncbi:MAG: SCP2 sterol-binding domain-containing protein [bacterium]